MFKALLSYRHTLLGVACCALASANGPSNAYQLDLFTGLITLTLGMLVVEVIVSAT